MALVPITQLNFADKSFSRPTTYSHAKGDLITRIAAEEIQSIAEGMIISFLKEGETFKLVAVLGISNSHKNVYVTKKGKWIGAYVPARYRAYPFGLAELKESKMLLCIDNSYPSIRNDLEGIRFFEADGSKSQYFMELTSFLAKLHEGILITDAICAELASLECIVPWNIKLKTLSGESISEGLYQIDEHKLGKFDGKVLESLRNSGALQLSYMQLFSRVHVRSLSRLQAFHERDDAELSDIGSQIFDPGDEQQFNFDVD